MEFLFKFETLMAAYFLWFSYVGAAFYWDWFDSIIKIRNSAAGLYLYTFLYWGIVLW